MSFDRAMNIVGLVLAVAGIFFAFYFGKRGRERPVLGVAADTDVLVRSSDDELERLTVRYHGERIAQVARTLVAFWHQQGAAVRKDDIVDSDPLCINLSSGDVVLSARVVTASRSQIDFSIDLLSSARDKVFLKFDYLDVDDGAIIEILHQGSVRPHLSGTIKAAAIRDYGDMDLAQRVAAANGGGPRVVRSWQTVKRFWAAGLAFLTGCWGVMGLILELNPEIWGRPRPVLLDPTRYDLVSLSGQKAFMSDVDKYGLCVSNYPIALWVFAIFAFFFYAIVATSLVRERNAPTKIPRSLTSVEPGV